MRPAPPRTGSVWPEPVTSCVTSGLRTVVLERSGPVVALRLTVATGARDDHVAGATHMVEHLLFRTRAGAEARHAVEAAGGEMGATTTREQLSIDVVVLPDDLELAFAALGRVLGAVPSPTDLARERAVVLREIAHEGEERRLIWQLQAEALYGDSHPLARPILGTAAAARGPTFGELDAARRQHAGMTARRHESSRQLAAWVSTQLLWEGTVRHEEPFGDLAAVEPADVREACAGRIRDGYGVASVGRLRPRH